MIKQLLILPLAAAPCFGLTIITEGHTDIGVAYEDGAWDLHIGREDEENPGEELELDPADTLLYGDDTIRLTAPGSGALSFLGGAGDPVWVFPQTQNTSALFLGMAAHEIGAEILGNVTISLVGFSGPGDFFLYQLDGGGNPTILMDSTDGFASDSVSLSAGGHAHYNWAFTEEGVYQVVLQASGVLNDGLGTISYSDPTTYTFGINQVPEPGHYALMAGLALAALTWRMRKRG